MRKPSMKRAMALSREHGLGCVCLGNTNHWIARRQLRLAGRRGRADRHLLDEYTANLPLGSRSGAVHWDILFDCCAARKGSCRVDMAMSQFSYGTLRLQAGGEMPAGLMAALTPKAT